MIGASMFEGSVEADDIRRRPILDTIMKLPKGFLFLAP
jgi:hypothetical protein